ncbi:MAG TPA: nucleotidyltransferase family protein [Candidatus Sulfotelmatobacter sp.]|jgi:MurNAc alpha-1-phosphate uridylyltransferase|nr:nucleotidyltransferase family protein [Candidatus Sulfotelmatobacter sp.]
MTAMTAMPAHAMILAAGLGLRMRPITETIPKPLVSVAGRTMLDRVLDHLDEAGVPNRVVNMHWRAEKIVKHLAGRSGVTLSDETDLLLETGGGVAKALPLLGDAPFFVCNADILWRNGPVSALRRLAAAWDGDKMDALLLMAPTAAAFGYEGQGDFFLDPAGQARRRTGQEISPYVFAGVQILHPRLFAGVPSGAFSLNLLYNRAQDEGRLYGVAHDGEWYHIGTPEALAEAETLLARRDSTGG